MEKTRGARPPIRRARLLAARGYGVRSIPRTAILKGHWDAGTKVRDHLTSEAARRWAASRGFEEE